MERSKSILGGMGILLIALVGLLLCCSGGSSPTPAGETGDTAGDSGNTEDSSGADGTTTDNGGTTGTGGTTTEDCSTLSPVVFSYSPIDLADIDYIIPFGNMNPPAHTFPTSHIYLQFKDRNKTSTVYAPVDGSITRIFPQGSDYKVNIPLNTKMTLFLDHILLSQSILNSAGAFSSSTGYNVANPVTIKAGDILGTTSGRGDQLYAMDIGLMNYCTTVSGLLSPSRYPDETVYAEFPLKYYQDPLKTSLYALIRRDSQDKEGKIGYDVAGRLVGNWFFDDTTGNNDGELAIVYDVEHSTQIRISTNGYLSQYASGIYSVQDGATDPANVSTASGIVPYELYIYFEDPPRYIGRMLVQMTADDKITAEYIGYVGLPITQTTFTSNARTLTR